MFAEIGLADLDGLDQQHALVTIKNCEVWPLKNLLHFRSPGVTSVLS
jgi:hypothetical protein